MFIYNPFPHSVPIWHRLAKLSILILEGIMQKIPMSVATMSRYTKRAYHRLCPEKRRKKKNSGGKGLKKNCKIKKHLSRNISLYIYFLLHESTTFGNNHYYRILYYIIYILLLQYYIT